MTALNDEYLPEQPPDPITDQARAELREIMARYPRPRSAILPMMHLLQSVQGYVTADAVRLVAELLDLSTSDVIGVVSYYTMLKRHPVGRYHIGVCTNTLCAVMGGDAIFAALQEHLGIGNDEVSSDGVVSVEHVECNAGCDYAPIVMANWEFFDNMTPESARQLVDDLRAGVPVRPSRGPDRLGTFREAERVLAGFPDGHADEGPTSGARTVVGLELARERGWAAPIPEPRDDAGAAPGSEGGR